MSAAVLAVIERDGLYLAVPHRITGKLGFPGGKVEERENIFDALSRECEEEIGVRPRLLPDNPYRSPVDGVWVYAVRCEISQEPRAGDTGEPVWVTREALLSPETACYIAEARMAFDARGRS